MQFQENIWIAQKWRPLFGGKNDVDQKLCERLGHGGIRVEPLQGSGFIFHSTQGSAPGAGGTLGFQVSRFQREENLDNFTDLLLMGITEITEKNEKKTEISGLPALETTVKGRVNKEETQIRTVIVKKDDCIYDLMYVTRPKHFESQLENFNKFVASFRVK